MKKSIKKLLSVVLATIFILSALSAFPISAASLDDDLIIHYDFEGATEAEAREDKKGSYDLTQTKGTDTGATDNPYRYDLTHGTVTALESTKCMLRTTSYVNEADGLANNTVFTRAKLESNHLKLAYIAAIRWNNANQPLNLYYDKDAKCMKILLTDAGGTAATYSSSEFTWPTVAETGKYEYVNFAVTIVEEEGTYYLNLYYSVGLADSATEWTTAINKQSIGTTINTTTRCVAVASSSGQWQTGVTIDDFRLYGKALTLDEIATIIPNGSFDMSEVASFYGAQYKDSGNSSTYNIRFVGACGDLTGYSQVGYEIILSGTGVTSKKFVLESATVYRAILASSESGITEVFKATDIGAEALIALTITNVPVAYDNYEIKTFVIDGETKIYTDTQTMVRPSDWAE